jgi:hypothetical protein
VSDETVKRLKQRATAAWNGRSQYDAMLRDVYDYVMPYRDVTGLHVPNGRSEGERRVDKVFDATAMKAAYRFAGRMQTELTPIFQPFFALEAGPLVPDGDEKKTLSEQLQKVGEMVAGILASGSFHTRSHEMYLDLFAGTGAMFMADGDDDDLVRFATVPIAELALESGPWGDIWHIYWRRSWLLRDLKARWPNGKFDAALLKAIEDQPDTKTNVWQYTRYDEPSKTWKLLVWCDRSADDAMPIHAEDFRVSPWLTPRFFVVPGEAYGRGPAQQAMPFIKTGNKARELTLKAGSLAVSGVWTRRDDGVFNPDTAVIAPGTMWAVASNGGPLGPTVQRLDIPGNFDMAQVVMQEERDQMKQALFDDTLPPDTAAVRSATEIAERMRRLSQDLAGVYGRLTLEIIKPLVQRVIDVLERKGKLPTNIKIDQLLTQVRVVSPIAAGQNAASMSAAVNAMQMVGMLGGPQAPMVAFKVEDLYPQIGRWSGIEEKYIRSQADQKKTMAGLQQMQTAQVQAEADAKASAAAPAEPPGAQYVNGGAQ